MFEPEFSLQFIKVREPHGAGAEVQNGEPPLLILLHGVGSNEQDLARYAGHFDSRFLIVSVQAPFRLAENSFAWFQPVIAAEEAEASRCLLIKFVDNAAKRFGIASRIFLLGFSQARLWL